MTECACGDSTQPNFVHGRDFCRPNELMDTRGLYAPLRDYPQMGYGEQKAVSCACGYPHAPGMDHTPQRCGVYVDRFKPAVLNPPPEPDQTFDEWLKGLEGWVDHLMGSCARHAKGLLADDRLEQRREELLAHARKRIRT